MLIFRDINAVSVTLRLVMAMLCGGLLGLNREYKRRPAGLKTYMLVCMGAALVMLTSQYVIEQTNQGDLLRMGAQVISGIGFLGAGTIITNNRQVKGLTTAAGLWAAACLGLAAGIGFYVGTVIGCVFILIVFSGFHHLEEKLAVHASPMTFYVEAEGDADLAVIIRALQKSNLTISEVQIERKPSKQVQIISFCVHLQNHQQADNILQSIVKIPEIRHVQVLSAV